MTLGKSTGDSRLSVRLTPEERLELERRAAGMRISDYARKQLLGSKQSKHRDKAIAPHDQAHAQILGLLGQSQIFQSLTDLAEGVRVGALPTDDETKNTIQAARAELSEIKSLLMAALRTKER